jgi:hypothetical protein
MLARSNLPPGQLDIPSAWRGEEMAAKSDRWLVRLAAAEITELEQAAKSFLATSREIGTITKDKFPVAAFRPPPCEAQGNPDRWHRL